MASSIAGFLARCIHSIFPLSSDVNGSPCFIPQVPSSNVAMENALQVMGKTSSRGIVRSPLPLLIAGWVFSSIGFHKKYPQPTGILRWTFPCQNTYNQRSMWPNPNFCCLFISGFHGENPPTVPKFSAPSVPRCFLIFSPWFMVPSAQSSGLLTTSFLGKAKTSSLPLFWATEFWGHDLRFSWSKYVEMMCALGSAVPVT